ncbi:hypothetical protein GCM10009639_67290 [Kitasatospora putterlickiae]|uniref:Uncharacterized protein n=1 Tax=Kitasatospora putterlickiae TaxID=221725 RepID=A0ABN1YHB5_9ACTN
MLTGVHGVAFTAHGRVGFGSAGHGFNRAGGRFGGGVNGAVNTRLDGAHVAAFAAHGWVRFGSAGARFSGGGRGFGSGR